MLLRMVWRKVRLYKRFEIDIWGFRLLSLGEKNKVNRLFNFWDAERAEMLKQRRARYIYRIDRDQPARKRKRQKWHFVVRRLSRLFYLTLSYSQFRKLARTASRLEGSWESSFIMLIENRVMGMLYRMQFLMSVFELRPFILRGRVLVNNKKITYYNAAVNYGDVMRIGYRESIFLRYDIFERFARGSLYFTIPRYMFISYKLMFGFVYREPKRRDLAFPIKAIDIFRSAEFY